jgi:hypothetical protein
VRPPTVTEMRHGGRATSRAPSQPGRAKADLIDHEDPLQDPGVDCWTIAAYDS